MKLIESNYINGKPHGLWRWVHHTSYDAWIGHYENGKKHGEWTYRHTNGQLIVKENYKDGKKHGKWVQWFNSGELLSVEHWHEGEPVGIWRGWYSNTESYPRNGQLHWEKSWFHCNGQYHCVCKIWNSSGKLLTQ